MNYHGVASNKFEINVLFGIFIHIVSTTKKGKQILGFYLKRSKKRGGFLKRGLEIVLTRDNSERKKRERESF